MEYFDDLLDQMASGKPAVVTKQDPATPVAPAPVTADQKLDEAVTKFKNMTAGVSTVKSKNSNTTYRDVSQR